MTEEEIQEKWDHYFIAVLITGAYAKTAAERADEALHMFRVRYDDTYSE